MIETIEHKYEGASFTDVPEDAASLFNRRPYGFGHTLSGLDLFDFDALCALAQKYERDYYVSGGATAPDEHFYSVRSIAHSPYDALRRLDAESQRVLLKRPEQYDARYRDVMHALFEQIVRQCGGLGSARVVRLDSSILITSAATTTPFHFDPEFTFFFQIEGPKSYHLYLPAVLSEPELESFYWMGIVNIGQVGLEGRDPAREFVFELTAGKGMHQPQNSPHWVQTQGSRSISYAISFETDVSRELGRTRAFNYYQRKLGVRPAPLGAYPKRDAAKAMVMRAAVPLRKGIGSVVRKLSAVGAKA
jgi:hypothetical protein